MSGRDKIDVLVFGDAAIDDFYEVGSLPRINNSADVSSWREFYGGMGANTAVVSRSLGLRTALVSVIGADAKGEGYRKYLQNLGIDLRLKRILNGDTTRSMFFKEDGRQISFFYKGVTEKMDELEFDKGLIHRASCIYMARTYLNLQKRVSYASRNRFLVYNPGYGVFDFESVPKKFYQILKNVNVLVLNDHELRHLKTIGFSISHRLGPSVFIITRGEKGTISYSNGVQMTVPVYKTDSVDASGAGDAFNAGFIAAHLRGFETHDAINFANATASFIVEKWGCQTNLPTWEMVKRRYDELDKE